MTHAHAHDVGAWPRFAPQMAESILVQKIYPMNIGRFPASKNGLFALFTPGIHQVCYKVLWTDTDGYHHGRAWVWSLERLIAISREQKVGYPIAIASTEAGCIWIYRENGHDSAYLQTTTPRGIPIAIENLDPSKPDEQRRAVKGLFKDGMTWERCTGDEHEGYQVWFGDDLEDGEVKTTVGTLGALANMWDHDIRTLGRDV